MMITLLIYTIVLSVIIFKGFYKTILFMKPFSVRKNTESLVTSIRIESLPFYSNQGKIHLFAFFINFIFLSFISCILLPDLIFNHVVFCMETSIEEKYCSDNKNFVELTKKINQQPKLKTSIYNNNNNGSFQTMSSSLAKNVDNKLMELNRVSNIERPFLFNLNYSKIEIDKPQKVLNGIAFEFEEIKNQYNIFIKENLYTIDKQYISIGHLKNIYKNTHTKTIDMLYLTSNAFNKAILSSFTPCSDDLLSEILLKKMDGEDIKIDPIIKSFLGLGPYSKDVIFLSEQTRDLCSILENSIRISKENYEILKKENNLLFLDDIKCNLLKSIEIYIEENIKFKKEEENENVQELYNFCNKIQLLIYPENNLSIYSIKHTIEVFHNLIRGVYNEIYIINCKAVEERGFILKLKNCSYPSNEEKFNLDKDDY